MIQYISTRGRAPTLNFEEVVLAGLATDGGLYVPDHVPSFTPQEILALAGKPYADLAVEVMWPFIGDAIDRKSFSDLVHATYHDFRHPAVAPLVQLDANEWVLELFHGPTLAFKDFALQFLGRMLDHILQKRGQKIVIVGATSGDTGSAAIAGCQGRENMEIFILHPHGRVSDVQRRQMTTVLDENVHNIALQGAFDDCQDIVKGLFGDEAFRTRHHLVAVNSINWARILAQVVYYFYAALALGAPARKVVFSVPTGNFGDIFAGHIARRMGLPIELIIATNRNDILARCLATGTYGSGVVEPSLSPSMDIQVSSNFERLLFELHGESGATTDALMQRFKADKTFTLGAAEHNRLQGLFTSAAVSDEETLAMIAETYHRSGYVLDPHTAVGVAAGRRCHAHKDSPLVTLATAHPAKFPDAVHKACGVSPALPPHLADLHGREERVSPLPNDIQAVKRHIEEHIG